jgi:hypothetical protein
MSLFGWIAKKGVETAADAAVPGLGTIGGKIWDLIKPILPWLILAALLFGLHLWDRGRYADARVTKAVGRYEASMKTATERINHARAVLAGADDALKRQNASILAQAKAQADAMNNARKLLAAADKRDIGRHAQIASLQSAAARPIDGTPCKSLPEVDSQWH